MKTIGIDIGGTKIAVGTVDQFGKCYAQVVFPTLPEQGFPLAMDRISQAIERVLHQSGWLSTELIGIGIGCTGPIDPELGTIHNRYTLPTWDGCNIVDPIARRFGVCVSMENDADAAAMGEFKFGAGRNANPIVLLTLGTGIGFSAIINGQIYRGVNQSHAELGHIPILPDGPECYCGIRGCFESIASGSGLENAARSIGLSGSREVFKAASAGSLDACQIVERAMEATGIAAWTIAHSFLPERLILGGGIISEHFKVFASAIQASLDRAVMIPKEKMEVVQASLGNAAGVIGAASLVMTDHS